MKRFVPLAVATLAFAACQDASAPDAARPTAPFSVNAARSGPIPGDYIVTLRDDVGDVGSVAQSIARLHNGQLKHLYTAALRGFAIRNVPDAVAAAIANDPRVLRVEQDQEFHIVTTTPNPQANPPSWGLDRIDQRSWATPSHSYAFSATGNGVTAYIIDTGIDFTHPDLEGRAQFGVDEISPSTNGSDCNGHGTHVSGTVGGATYGVAKDVSLVAVRVLDCSGSGSTSGVAAGIDWVTAQKNSHPAVPMVANMSLGGGASATLDQAVTNSINAGVTYAIAAGNGNIFGFAVDACTTSPARVAAAITVSATDNTDTKASWANYGTCVDIFAPGVSITSSWWSSSGQRENTISGTSMATPHVTGAAALYLETHPTATPAAVAAALVSNATAGVVKSPGSGTPNRLLYTGSEAAPPPPLTAGFTKSCSGLKCNFTNTTTNTTPNTTYSWNFGDGSAAATTNASHTFAARRSYTITLTATDGTASSAKSQTVTCNRKNCS